MWDRSWTDPNSLTLDRSELTHDELISIDAIELVIVLITIVWCFYTNWCVKFDWLRARPLMMAFEGEIGKNLVSQKILLQLWWLLLGDEV